MRVSNCLDPDQAHNFGFSFIHVLNQRYGADWESGPPGKISNHRPASPIHSFHPHAFSSIHVQGPGRVAQSVMCLATDACLTADPGVTSSIPVRSHTFVEIDHEMISTDQS